MQADRFAEEILAFADNANVETVNKARLQFDARRWLASKISPKVYGERQTIDHNIQLQDLDPAELLARANQLASNLGITLPENVLKLAKHKGDGD